MDQGLILEYLTLASQAGVSRHQLLQDKDRSHRKQIEALLAKAARTISSIQVAFTKEVRTKIVGSNKPWFWFSFSTRGEIDSYGARESIASHTELLVNNVLYSMFENSPERMLSLFPLFATLLGERDPKMRFAEIDWSLFPATNLPQR